MFNVGITGVGSYLPEKILTNYELEKMVDTSNEWIVTRTGIEERRIAEDNQSSSDLGLISSQRALKSANLKSEDIDLIIVSTLAPDMIFPSTACFLQAKLGAKNAVAFDVVGACTGFIFGMATAVQYIQSGLYKNVLVTAAECCSKFTDWKDRNTCVLFGDGAGSVVLSRTEKNKIKSIDLHSDGTLSNILDIPAGGSKLPASYETVNKRLHYMRMDGPEVYKAAVKFMRKSSMEAIKKAEINSGDIDFVITHQANLRIIDSLKKKLKISDDKVMVNLQKYGNTSSATIPIGLDEAIKEHKVKEGDTILITAAGGGFTYGSIIFEL